MYLWMHVESEIGINAQHQTLEPVLAGIRNFFDLFVGHISVFDLVLHKESHIEQTSNGGSEVNRN